MGYTHYYTQKRNFNDMEWKLLQKAFYVMLREMPETSENAGKYYSQKIILAGGDGTGNPECTDELICFNGEEGEEDLFHEGFLLLKSMEDEKFNFCKTARKPYDLAVCTMLLIIKMIGKVYDISSDGDMKGEEWEHSRTFSKKVFKIAKKEFLEELEKPYFVFATNLKRNGATPKEILTCLLKTDLESVHTYNKIF